MQLLPYDSFTIQTQDSLSDVIKRLEAQIEAPKAFRSYFSRNHAPYEGRLDSTGFDLNCIIHYRNSFLPNIRGRFESLPNRTVISVTMRLHPLVTAFLIFWFLVWYGATIPIFLSGAMSGDVTFEPLLFLGMPIVVLFTFWCAFWYEANRSRQELIQIINGEPLKQQTAGMVFKVFAIAAIILFNAWFFFQFFQPKLQPNPAKNSKPQTSYPFH
jgi:hypothetical protein